MEDVGLDDEVVADVVVVVVMDVDKSDAGVGTGSGLEGKSLSLRARWYLQNTMALVNASSKQSA